MLNRERTNRTSYVAKDTNQRQQRHRGHSAAPASGVRGSAGGCHEARSGEQRSGAAQPCPSGPQQ